MSVHLYSLSLLERKRKLWWKHSFTRVIRKRRKFETPYKLIFQEMAKRFRKIRNSSHYYEKSIIDMLDKIISNDYFGTTQNRRRFYYVVKKIITQSRFEHVFKTVLYEKYDISSIKWIRDTTNDVEEGKKLLLQANIDLLDFIVKPLIKHFFCCVPSLRGYKMEFIPRRTWAAFQARSLRKLLEQDHLIEENSTESRGDLKIYPKRGLSDYRAVMQTRKLRSGLKYRYMTYSKAIYELASRYNIIGSSSLLKFWSTFIEESSNNVIYGLKIDIQDAYGNVQISVLCDAISRSSLSPHTKRFLVAHMKRQFVTYNKKVYRWNHGLLQGDRLSGPLFHLYMCIIESENLKDIITNHYTLHRLADDYLYCSTRKQDLRIFEETLLRILPINESKIERACGGFSLQNGNSGTDENHNCEITYIGKVINFETKQIGKLYEYKDRRIRYKFRFWNMKKIDQTPDMTSDEIRSQALSSSVAYVGTSHCFTNLEINTIFNTEETVLCNFYKGMIFVAFKLDSAVRMFADLDGNSEDFPCLIPIIDTAIEHHSCMVHRTYLKRQGKHHKNGINVPMLKTVAHKAFICVLRHSSNFYKGVIDHLNWIKKTRLSLSNREAVRVFNRMPEEFHRVLWNRKPEI